MATVDPAAAVVAQQQQQQRDSSALRPNGDDGQALEEGSPTKSVEQWVPVTTSPTAKWWYTTGHIVTALVGAGVLALPAAMGYLGGIAGICVLLSLWWLSWYTLMGMVDMHEQVATQDSEAKRFKTYLELAQEAFGEKLASWTVQPLQIMAHFGVTIVYVVAGSQALFQFVWLLYCSGGTLRFETRGCGSTLSPSGFSVVYSLPLLLLAQLRAFNFISSVSIATAIMALGYSTISWTDALAEDFPNSDYQTDYPGELYYSRVLFQMCSALGILAFACSGAHNVVLEIQATIPSSPESPSRTVMRRSVALAYILVGITYFLVAVAGHRDVGMGFTYTGNILLSLNSPRWLLAGANLLVVVHVTWLYLHNAMPLFAMMDTALEKKLGATLGQRLRSLPRIAYVLTTVFIAAFLPLFDEWAGFVGGVALAPLTYILPCAIWLRIRQPMACTKSWVANWVLIGVGVVVALLASIGGLQSIIADALSLDKYLD